MSTHAYNASLSYTINKKRHLHLIWVMSYTQPFQLSGVEEQSRLYQHFYSKSYTPGDMAIVGRTPHQTEYNNLAEFIRGHHMTIMNNPGVNNNENNSIPLLRLEIPSEGISVRGVVKSFVAGAKRFNVAPEFNLDLMVIENELSNLEKIRAEYTVRNTWTGNFVGSAPTNSQSSNAPAQSIAPPPSTVGPPTNPGSGPGTHPGHNP